MTPTPSRIVMRLALVGALIAALGMGACGRKSGLDPPPGASLGWFAPAAEGGTPFVRDLLKWLLG